MIWRCFISHLSSSSFYIVLSKLSFFFLVRNQSGRETDFRIWEISYWSRKFNIFYFLDYLFFSFHLYYICTHYNSRTIFFPAHDNEICRSLHDSFHLTPCLVEVIRRHGRTPGDPLISQVLSPSINHYYKKCDPWTSWVHCSSFWHGNIGILIHPPESLQILEMPQLLLRISVIPERLWLASFVDIILAAFFAKHCQRL